MKYFSTRGNPKKIDFIEVLTSGTAKDGGLYIPESFPKFSEDEINSFCEYLSITKMQFTEIADSFRNLNIWEKSEDKNWKLLGYLLK